MQRRTCDAAAILANLELMVNVYIERIACKVMAPTLLLHARGDRSVAASEGSRLASCMPNAEIVLLEDDNHIFLPYTFGFEQALGAIEIFLDKWPRLQAEQVESGEIMVPTTLSN